MSPSGSRPARLWADRCSRCGAPVLYGTRRRVSVPNLLCPPCAARELRLLLSSAATETMMLAVRLEPGSKQDRSVVAREMRALARRLRDAAPPRSRIVEAPRRPKRRRRREEGDR